MDYLGLVQVGESGLVIGSCTCENYFGIQYRMKVILDLVPGFEIVLVLQMLILKQGKGVPELLGFVLCCFCVYVHNLKENLLMS